MNHSALYSTENDIFCLNLKWQSTIKLLKNIFFLLPLIILILNNVVIVNDLSVQCFLK